MVQQQQIVWLAILQDFGIIMLINMYAHLLVQTDGGEILLQENVHYLFLYFNYYLMIFLIYY